MQWIHEGKKPQTEIQHLQNKVYKLQKQSQEIMDVARPNLEKTFDEPLPMKMIQLQTIAATKATILATISNWRTFQDRLLLTTPAVVNTFQENYPRPLDATDP